MNSKLSIVLIVLLATFSESCQKENLNNNPELYIGDWQTERVELNGKDWAGHGTILSLDTKTLYYKNYVGGNWKVIDKVLTLTPIDDINIPPHSYKVISVSETSLVLEIEMTEGEYFHDFEEFEKDELIRITEYYKLVE